MRLREIGVELQRALGRGEGWRESLAGAQELRERVAAGARVGYRERGVSRREARIELRRARQMLDAELDGLLVSSLEKLEPA